MGCHTDTNKIIMKRINYLFALFLLGLIFPVSLLHAQVNLQNIEFSGYVLSDGKGIEGVAVTDGFNIVQTNSKGKYKLLSNATAEFVYITLPAGYAVPIKINAPCLYARVKDKVKPKQRFDFILEKLNDNEDKHAFIVWADPQVYFEDELPTVKDAALDVASLISNSYKDTPVYGMVCGDLVGDADKEPLFYDPIKQILADTDIPFFYLAGNHDLNLNVRSDHFSKTTFKNDFGPVYYSFNRGKIHYVVLDDCFYNGNSYYYIGYLYEQQLNWLEQDLALIPEGSSVVVSLHIPTYSPYARKGEYAKESMTRVLQNRRALYDLLKPYKAHIFSGHEHRNENFAISENLYEHNHAAMCGLFWDAPWCSDGTPRGYGVYEVDGDHISWYFKTVGKDKDYQFKLYPVGWSNEKPDAVIANIWNHDPLWKVFWYEDGKKMGEMQSFSGLDPDIDNYIKENRKNFKHSWSSASPTEHLFFAEPSIPDSKIKVEVIDRFGNSYIQELDNQ